MAAGNGTENKCFYPAQPELSGEFYLVVIFGTFVCCVCIIENIPLVYIFASKPNFRNSSSFYLLFLASFDIFIAISYVMVMTVQVLFDYLRSYGLSKIWHGYVLPLFSISKVSMAASTYLIVAVTFERFFLASRLMSFAMKRESRLIIVSVAVFAAVIFQGSVFAEFKVERE